MRLDELIKELDENLTISKIEKSDNILHIL
jgi:hypothetical protein